MKFEFSGQIFEKKKNKKFHEIPCSGSRVVLRPKAIRETEMKVIIAFRTFGNTPRIAFIDLHTKSNKNFSEPLCTNSTFP